MIKYYDSKKKRSNKNNIWFLYGYDDGIIIIIS